MPAVLVVDDSELVRKTVSLVLTKKGYDVCVAAKALDGVRWLKDRSFDLILMDLNLPDGRGEKAIQTLRDVMQVETPILVISSEIKIDTVLALKPFGVVGFIDKQLGFGERLLEEIRRVLHPTKWDQP